LRYPSGVNSSAGGRILLLAFVARAFQDASPVLITAQTILPFAFR
jgi:hypothetical protein